MRRVSYISFIFLTYIDELKLYLTNNKALCIETYWYSVRYKQWLTLRNMKYVPVMETIIETYNFC